MGNYDCCNWCAWPLHTTHDEGEGIFAYHVNGEFEGQLWALDSVNIMVDTLYIEKFIAQLIFKLWLAETTFISAPKKIDS